VNWNPTALPPGETVETLRAAHTLLINQFLLGPVRWDTIIIDDLMKKTYSIQRYDINGGCLTAEVIEKWPFIY
jgi:hypothetical protein